MPWALVIFDLDGTLVNSVADLASSLNVVLAELGLPERSEDEVAGFVGEGARRLVEKAVGTEGERADRALARFLAVYEDRCVERTRAYPGVADLLAALERERLPLVVATNKPGRMARKILAALGLLSPFRAVLGGDEGPRKPDPALVERLRALVAAPREGTVLVGDSRVDLETARAAGIDATLVGWGIGSAELAARGERLVPSVEALLEELRRGPSRQSCPTRTT